MAQCPIVALISSPNAQSHAISRGFKSISHIFYPFGTHELAVRDPVNFTSNTHNIKLDVRDISNDGHLLSLSVLPYVLTQALKNSSSVAESVKTYRKVLSRWAEPSDHESFGAYLACLFVVSTVDENPLGELSKLIQTQQTLYNSSSTLIIPPYCCSPKWATGHAKTLKHYILLNDANSNGNEKKEELFKQMCATYGTINCQLLEFDSSTSCSSEMANKWSEIDEFNDILNRGLEDAMKHAADSNSSTPITGTYTITTPTTPTSSVSTISSSLPSVSAGISPNMTRSSTTNIFWKNSDKIFSKEDGEKCEYLLKKFLNDCLIPHVEKEMKHLQEQVGTRRGIIGKSITSGMKKWFTTGTQSNITSPTSYSWDSPEMQLRRLADMSFMFGNYNYAYQQYRVLKKDLEADQAMLAHAMASEMCAVSLNIAQPNLNAKQFPLHYLESAVTILLTHSSKYLYVLRCALHSSDVFSNLECFKEAANILSKLASIDADHVVGVVQSLAATMFEKTEMFRKASFYRVLAANRFSNAGISNLAFDCYRLAIPSFEEKHWGVLDEHLAVKLLTEGEKAGLMTSKIAMNCVRRLVAVCPKLTPTLQGDRLRKIVYILDAYSSQNEAVVLDLPKIDVSGIKVIYGERPMWNEIDEDENTQLTPDEWVTVERSAHYSIFGATTPFRGMQLVSDLYSDNTKVRETPAGERYRVMIDVTNPLSVPIHLRNVRLSVSKIETKEGLSENIDVGSLAELSLAPNEMKTIELYVFPRKGCLRFNVDGLLFRLMTEDHQIGVEAKIPLEIKGKRLNKTVKHHKGKMYAIDERLKATVADKPWPLIEFKMIKSPSKWAYCDQAIRYLIEIENIGNEDVVSMSLATNGFDRVAAGFMDSNEKRINVSIEKAANISSIGTFLLKNENNQPFLKIGEKKRIFFDVRGGQEPTFSSSSTTTTSGNVRNTVILIAYRGTNGAMREWRKVVDVERRRLVDVKAKTLDEESGIISLNIKNCLLVSQAALSKIEILRIRCAKNEKDARIGTIEIVKPRKIEIESDQNDTVVLELDSKNSSTSEFCFENLDKVDIPKWPCPTVRDDEIIHAASRKIGVLWKANIVNNDGHVSSFIGETFVDDPIENDSVIRVIGQEENSQHEDYSKLKICCDAQKYVSHDFNSSRICELPIRIKIRNTLDSPADISIRYIAKVREAVDGIHLVPPELRQQMWVDRPIQKSKLAALGQNEFVMKVRVSNASVYDIGGNNLIVDAVFEGSERTISYKVPSILSVVKAV